MQAILNKKQMTKESNLIFIYKNFKIGKTKLFLDYLKNLLKIKTKIIIKVMMVLYSGDSESDVIDCSRCSLHKYCDYTYIYIMHSLCDHCLIKITLDNDIKFYKCYVLRHVKNTQNVN